MRRAIVKCLAIAATLAILSGCSGLVPVYGEGSPMAGLRFNFAEPETRTEQIIVQRLAQVFPQPAGPDDPELKVTTYTTGVWGGISNAMAIGRPAGIRVEGRVTIMQDGEEVFTAFRFTDTTYQAGKLTGVDLASKIAAEETAARGTAESLRTAILAGYRPGMTPRTPLQNLPE